MKSSRTYVCSSTEQRTEREAPGRGWGLERLLTAGHHRSLASADKCLTAPPRPANCFLTSVLSLTFWWLCCCAAALLRGCSVHTCNLVRGISAQPSCQVPSPGSGSGRGRGGSGSRLSGCIQSDPDQTGWCNKYSRPTWHRAATHLPATGWGRGNIKSMKAVYK